MNNKKGITLTSLIIIIVVMLILAGTATYTGISVINHSKRTKFNTELRVIHARVDEIAEEGNVVYGRDISTQTDEIKSKIQTALGGVSSTGFRYFERQDLEAIGATGIDRQVIINFTTREVVDINGLKTDEGYIYRMEGWKPVQYINPNTDAPTFELSRKVYGITATIEVQNIEYKNDVSKGTIKYGELVNGTVANWKTGAASITIQKSGTYRVQITDAAGNVAEKDIEITLANKPKLVTGMTPIIYNKTTGVWDEVEETSGIWYDYASDAKMWANIKTTSTTANSDGTYNEAQWVWIPRYAYQVPERPTAESDLDADVPEFKIAFLKGNTNVPINQADLGGASIKLDTSGGVSTGDWVVHPAFTFGDQELTGIWVAKFEASSNAPNTVAYGGGDNTTYQVNVKPNVPSWRGITASNMFDVCRNMTATTGVLEGMFSTDPHMMKNIEWGCVVYLAQSKHGKNGQVWNNPYGDETTSTILTGKASSTADSPNASYTTACDSYNTGNGPEASTTGNVYGIYDMAGGSYEYTAAYVNNSNAQSSSDITSLRTAVGNTATAKYVDLYVVAEEGDEQQANYEANASKYGDAVYETSYQGSSTTSWQKDRTLFPFSSFLFFERGGSYGTGEDSGVFGFTNFFGFSYFRNGFRPVCI